MAKKNAKMAREVTVWITNEAWEKMQITKREMSEHDYIKKIVESEIERDYSEFQRVAKMRQDAIRIIRLAEQISKEEKERTEEIKDEDLYL
jgi:ribosomal protein S8